MSLYLNGVQIIEKNIQDTGGFEATEGFDGSNFTAPTEETTSSVTTTTDDEDLPI